MQLASLLRNTDCSDKEFGDDEVDDDDKGLLSRGYIVNTGYCTPSLEAEELCSVEYLKNCMNTNTP